jgi:tRNA pseudouridine38-40 synthase
MDNVQRVKLIIEYEGTRYSGWQYQKGLKTIQGEIITAFFEAFGSKPTNLYGSGRTDSGVHALYQVAHLDIPSNIALHQLYYGLNDHLPHDIVVVDVMPCKPHFHARHDAVARSYVYLISNRKFAFGKKMVWWIKDELNLTQMDEALSLLEGFHDFASFTDLKGEQDSTKVDLELARLFDENGLLTLHFRGSHFLWKMVRRMVGVVVEVGRGNLSVLQIREALKNPHQKFAPYTAPPSGLFLEHVYYPNEQMLTMPKRIISFV